MKYAFALLMMLVAAVSLSAAGPAILLEEPVFNFGQVAEGARVEHTFRFKNSGDVPLVIEKVRSSCGCTAALLSTEVVPPGEYGEVKTNFNSSGFSGPVQKTIFIYSNDPLQKMVRLQLKGTVQKEVLLHPARLRFPSLVAGASSRATVSLTNQGPQPLFLSDLKTTSSEMTVILSATRLEPQESAQLEITVTPNAGKPGFAGYVTLHTSSPRNPLLRIPVTGKVTEPHGS
jgi:uncharacterized protein (DUF58 family)